MDRTMTCNMEDDWMFDEKLLDFDQDLDSLNLSLWQPNGFTVGSGCTAGDTDEPMKIEDIFQTDIADFTSGPTLAELNLVDDKLDSADLDEYLNDNNNNNTNNPVDSDEPKPNILSSSKNANTHGCYSNTSFSNETTASTTNTSTATVITALTPEEIDQLVSMTESSNANQDEFNGVCVNSVAPTPSSSLWDSVRTCSSLPATDSHQHKKGKMSIIEESPQPATASSSISNTISSMSTAMIIKEEPSSPNMDLSNLVISGSPPIEVKQEEPNEETSEDSDKLPYSSELSPEYLEQRPRRRTNSFSTECSLSSHDEGFASQQEDSDDNDQENDESDDESFYRDYEPKDLLGARTSDDSENKWALDMGRSRKSGQQRYFWQYNVQSKGPKGTRIISLQDICNDPHVLMEAKDPVFSPDCHVEGVKHAGKARRGDGNDLTPNPKKLLMIGLELKKLSRVINELTPVAQVPVTSRNKSRKEKNKLASRACRLKKKAQHEANKIKLYGLQQEHKRMMTVLTDVQNLATEVVEEGGPTYERRLTDTLEQILEVKGPRVKVAGNTAEFVNSVLDNVSSGCSDGGLNQL